MSSIDVNVADLKMAPAIEIESNRNELLKQHKISDEEYTRIEEILGRTPTFSELGVFSSMWSEHCSYKSSRIHLGRFPTESKDVVQGPGENAGVVRIDEKLCAAFKMESHNHPSYIEPYQGAATGVGGILRDVFCMGARPIANLNALRFGEKSHKKTHYLYPEVVRGIGDYGNCIGVPTVGGNVSFDPSYNGNILVNAMTVGVIHEDRIFKGYASGIGNHVVYLGSATGRDGIHGATMASDSFQSADEDERSTVQVGDPFTEKLLLEATLELLKEELVVGLQDMGAAGLTSSAFEMASRAGSGLYMNLDRVPVRAENMTAYELLLSESQERMLLVIEPSKWEKVSALLEKWQLSYGIIGEVTSTGRVDIVYRDKLEVSVPVDPIAEKAPKYDRPRAELAESKRDDSFDKKTRSSLEGSGLKENLKQLLNATEHKEFIFRQFDSQIGTKTVQSSREEGAAVLWPRSHWSSNKYVGIVVSTACNERYCAADPKLGASYAVLRCAQKIAAAGGTPLAITDCLNYGNPEDPKIMQEFSEGVDGISKACTELETPVVSGNVSLYNETDGESIAPTPMIGMVGRIDDVRKSRPALVEKNAVLYLMSAEGAEWTYSASRLSRIKGAAIRSGKPAEINWQAEKHMIQFLSKCEEIVAAREVADGGVLTTAIKMLGEHQGMKLNWKGDRNDLLAETSGAYLLATDGEKKFENIPGVKIEKVGVIDKGLEDIRVNEELVSRSTDILNEYLMTEEV